MASAPSEVTVRVTYATSATASATQSVRVAISPKTTMGAVRRSIVASIVARGTPVYSAHAGVIEPGSASAPSIADALAPFQLFLLGAGAAGEPEKTFLNPRRRAAAYELGFATLLFRDTRHALRLVLSDAMAKKIVVDETWYLAEIVTRVSEVFGLGELIGEWFSLVDAESGLWLSPRLQLCQRDGGPPSAVLVRLKYVLPLAPAVLAELGATPLLALYRQVRDELCRTGWGATDDELYAAAGLAAYVQLGPHDPAKHLAPGVLSPRDLLPPLLAKREKKRAAKRLAAAHVAATDRLGPAAAAPDAMAALIADVQALPYYGMRYFVVESAASAASDRTPSKSKLVLGISAAAVVLGAVSTPLPWAVDASLTYASRPTVLREYQLAHVVSWAPTPGGLLTVIFTELQIRFLAPDPFAICEALSTNRILASKAGTGSADGDAPPPLPSRTSSYEHPRRGRTDTISGSAEFQLLLTSTSDPSLLLQVTYSCTTMDELRAHLRSSLLFAGTEPIELWDAHAHAYVPLASLDQLAATANMGKLRIDDAIGSAGPGADELPELVLDAGLDGDFDDDNEFDDASGSSSLSSSFDEDFLLG